MKINEPEIIQYIHCRRCVENIPEGKSAKEYARYEVGWTKKGFQVWCIRHNMNICHIDLLGQKVDYVMEE